MDDKDSSKRIAHALAEETQGCFHRNIEGTT